MQAREADETVRAVLGHPPAEIAQRFQDPSFGSQPQTAREPCGAPWDLLAALHHTNQTLWKAEDAAHTAAISDEALGGLKRQIDSLNLRRNELIEEIDQVFRRMLPAAPSSGALPLHDSPGLVLDRLSIESLRAIVLRASAQRDGRASGRPDLLAIGQDIDALVERLREIIAAVVSGRRTLRKAPRVKIHRAPEEARLENPPFPLCPRVTKVEG
jgi:hypothetical protein